MVIDRHRMVVSASTFVAVSFFAAWGTTAIAADAPRPPVKTLPPVIEKQGHEWGLTFGVDVTSQYIDRGVANSTGAAVQPWAELTWGPLYFGYWGSNVSPSLADGASWEHDLAIGWRPMVGPVSLDVGYTRYIYNNGDCCGELHAIASINPHEPLTLEGAVFYDPDARDTYLEGGAAYALPHDLELSAAIGNQWFGDGSPSEFSWNAGLTWSPHEWLSLDGRYHGGPDSNKFVFTASFATSWPALRMTGK